MGLVWREGEGHYGRGQWRRGAGDTAFQLERLNHAAKHLYLAIHFIETGEYLGEVKDGEPEDDLAKVMVNVAMVMENTRMEQRDDAARH
jgi:hypothetical protein